MFPSYAQPGIFPEGRLHHLVVAACGDTDPQAAWQAYATALAGDFPNEGELRLFPLVADRLGGDPAGQPLAKYLQNAQRWARMQAMLNRQLATQTGALFRDAGIALMWTKGTALVARTDQRRDLRPSADLDALFRWPDVERILELATAQKWQPRLGLMADRAKARYLNTEISYRIGARGELDLQWLPRLSFAYDGELQDWLWQDPPPARDDTGTPYANDTWLLLEVLDHGLAANAVYPIRWVVDGVRLLHWRHDSIDWAAFVDIVTRNKLHHSYLLGLQTLARYSPHIPGFVLQALQKRPVNYLDREELKIRLSAENLTQAHAGQLTLNRLRREPSKRYYKSGADPLNRQMRVSPKTRATIAARNITTRLLFPLWYL